MVLEFSYVKTVEELSSSFLMYDVMCCVIKNKTYNSAKLYVLYVLFRSYLTTDKWREIGKFI